MPEMKPILFNTDMVRAILEDRKTVTRRAMKGYALEHLELDVDGSIIGVYDQFEGRVFPVMNYVPYHPGDILYVRETFQVDYLNNIPGSGRIHYKADDTYRDFNFLPGRYEMMRRAQLKPGWRPNGNMPREATRIFLRVTAVQVEKLQDITDDEAEKEGCKDYTSTALGFFDIWDSTIKPADFALYGWDANPWVFVISFERISKDEAMQ